jgi:flagellar M-ring protein FliF
VSDPKPLNLPLPVRIFLDRLGATAKGLSKPAKVLLLSTVLGLVAVGGWFGLRSAYEPYSVLFTQLEKDDAGAIVAKLKELKIPYKVTGEGGSIEVPEAKVHEVRLELASSGLPRGGGVGFESFDKMHLGATEFEQRVMYRRAMEGELARTIGSVDSIQSARVHLVLPEKSVFAARREPASASIIVKLRPGRAVGPAQVAGVVHLVASAVPGLVAENITLVTTEGTTLHKPRGSSGGDDAMDLGEGDRASQTKALETGVEDRARSMLERVLGPGHVDVRATAELDLARTERTEDRFDPSKSSLRSEEQTLERAASNDDTVAGVPGAESNLPSEKPAGSATAAAGAPPPGVTRESHTRNFEIDHVQEKRITAGGAVKRLAVAVVVDGVPGEKGAIALRPKAEIDRLALLVRTAVGADDRRGDVVTVDCVPFPVVVPEVEPAPRVSVMDKVPEPLRKYLPAAAGGVVLLLLVLGVAISRGRSKTNHAKAAEMALLTTSERAKELAASPEAKQLAPIDAEQRAEAIRRATDDPATAALVLRRWLGTAGVEAQPQA